MVFKTNLMKQRLNLFHSDLSVRRAHGKEFAASELFRRATFIDVNVCRLSANDCVVRLGRGFQAQHVRSRASENEKNFRVSTKLLAKKLYGARRVMIVAVGDDVAVVGSSDRRHNLRMNAGVVIAGKTAGWF